MPDGLIIRNDNRQTSGPRRNYPSLSQPRGREPCLKALRIALLLSGYDLAPSPGFQLRRIKLVADAFRALAAYNSSVWEWRWIAPAAQATDAHFARATLTLSDEWIAVTSRLRSGISICFDAANALAKRVETQVYGRCQKPQVCWLVSFGEPGFNRPRLSAVSVSDALSNDHFSTLKSE